ncbi:hypothetical protein AN957_10320 [Cytobacillus solani]|uniref:Uncharacterized protein n=1 Tax=Cytobacillus solani TaxID=1637975 RepID=A0A0Q3QLP7_9BACI|nr:hypothetical protein AMS60_05110 [Bacillus sp. FJAT-21945]KQL18929.1 hypothetical protein AN957_10320 [Cytobacillus solani]
MKIGQVYQPLRVTRIKRLLLIVETTYIVMVVISDIQLKRLAPRGHKAILPQKVKNTFQRGLPYACRG